MLTVIGALNNFKCSFSDLLADVDMVFPIVSEQFEEFGMPIMNPDDTFVEFTLAIHILESFVAEAAPRRPILIYME